MRQSEKWTESRKTKMEKERKRKKWRNKTMTISLMKEGRETSL